MKKLVTRLNPSNPNWARNGIESVLLDVSESAILQEAIEADKVVLETALAADKWEDDTTTAIKPKDSKNITTDILKAESILTPEIKTDTVAPTDLRIITGLDKTLEIDTVVWDDMQVSLGAVRQGSSAATWTPYKDSEVLSFAGNASNKIFFTIQYSHRIKDGSDTEFHIHTIAPDNTAGGVRWQLTVVYSRINGTFGTVGTYPVTQTIAANSADKHDIVTIKNPFTEDTGISTVALCSLSRLGNDGADDYANDIYLIALDSHFQIDTMGSRQRTAK